MNNTGLSSITKKAIVATTGLLLAGFVLIHMLGNLIIFLGPEAYNTYSHKITSNPLIYLVEIILAVAFIVHIVFAVSLHKSNRRARPQGYAIGVNADKAVGLPCRTMIYHGAALLVFVVFHLNTFKFGPHYVANYNGVEMRDLYRLVIEVFSDKNYLISYSVAMLLLCAHLFHGVSSIFQSWGFNHPVYTPILKQIGYIYAVGVAVGFLANPICVFLARMGGGLQ